ncbi:MAG: glycosyltransferase family 2 protein [Actinomycetota bacterium]|nr:glycosyltransferase family 2 protein [Actinomycetota bacterium]
MVIPTRNRSRLLATTLHSVLWQRNVDLEVIVVDDASTDGTADVVAGFADPRLVLMRQRSPCGPSAARNRGAGRAAGAWLAFVDDDDVWAPDKLTRQIAAADGAGRGWSYAGAVNIGDDLQIVSGSPPPSPEDVLAALPRYNPVPGGGSNVIIRWELWDDVAGFDERLPPCEDWDMWARLARVGPPASVAAPLMGYRLHSGSVSLDIRRILRSAELIEQLHATPVDWGRMHRWLAESCLRMDRHVQALGQFAMAAIRGQARGVASDVAAIARRRVGRRTRKVETPADRDWIAQAAGWLQELRSRVGTVPKGAATHVDRLGR